MDEGEWAVTELAEAALGDSRRTDRLVELASQLARQPERSLPSACQDGAQLKAAYHFFSNPHIAPQAVLAAHVQRTQERMQAQGDGVVLAVQDTTELDYSTHRATTGLGALNDAQQRGMLVHTTLALTPERVPLGLLAQEVLLRDPATVGKRHQRKRRAIGAKESHKWLVSLTAVNALAAQCPDTHLVSVGDREADVYEVLAAVRQPNVDVLVRAAWDRALVSQRGEAAHLWEAAEQAAEAGTLEVQAPARPATAGKAAQPGRRAVLTVRWGQVQLRPPYRAPIPGVEQERLGPVTVMLVWAHEDCPPVGAEALEWLLLTTEALRSPAQALVRVEWYACRWGIEVFHKVLKSGCRLEARQLGTAAGLERALTLYSIIAWRILWATLVVRVAPELPASVLLEREEWEALYCTVRKTAQPPSTAPTLREAVRWIAQVGGFLGRKGDGEPGVTVLWRGMGRLADLTAMYRILRPTPAPARCG